MPDLGEGLTEADLVEWTVAEGDTVELNQVIAEVETAKALVQLPSPFAGVIARLHVGPGTTVPVGEPIVTFDVTGGATADDTDGGRARVDGPPTDDGADPPDGDDDAPADGAERSSAPTRTAVLVGYGPPVDGTGHPTRRARRPSPSNGGTDHSPEASATQVAHASSPSVRRPERPRSFPPVRKLAHELGVDLAEVPGTGDDGLITREDLEDWVARQDRTSARAAPPADVAPASTPTTSAGRETRTPITGVRKHTAAAMVASAFTAPHATEFLTVDVTPSVDLLEAISRDKRFSGKRVTILALTSKALLIALRSHPSLNSRWDEEAGEIVQFGYVNLGIAAATPRGLLVPNLKDAETLDLAALADGITTLTDQARAGTTPPADLSRGTISITNIGVFGIDAGTPILNPGEAAILAMGAVRRRPWEHRGEIALRSVMTLSLSFDHRLVDGEQASRFLADVGRLLADPAMTMTMV